MSIKNNTTSLQDLLEQVNALPEAENLDAELATQDDLITQIQSAIDNLPEAGSAEPALQEKTVTPTTSSQTITPDSGYDGLGIVTVEGDANFLEENIKKDVTMWGKTGTYEGSGGGTSIPDTGTLTIVSNTEDYSIYGVIVQVFTNGTYSMETCYEVSDEHIFYNVVLGSPICVMIYSGDGATLDFSPSVHGVAYISDGVQYSSIEVHACTLNGLSGTIYAYSI